MASPTHSIGIWTTGQMTLSDVLELPGEPTLLYSLPDPLPRSMPATRKCKTDAMFPVTDALRAYMFGMNMLLHPELLDANGEPNAQFMKWWESCYNGARAFDNGNGFLSGHWKLENLYCAGFSPRPTTGEPDGKGWIEVYAIDPYDPPPVPTKLSDIDMTRNFFPTNSVWINGGPGNTPWAQFNGRFVHPFIGPNGRNWIRMGEYDGRGGMQWVYKIGNPFVPANTVVTAGLIPA